MRIFTPDPDADMEDDDSSSPYITLPRVLFAAIVLCVLAVAIFCGVFFGVPRAQGSPQLGATNVTQHSACWMPNMDMGPDCP